MKKQTTHFDQIPVEEVKKIADREAPSKESGDKGNVVVEPASRKTEPYSIWPGSYGTGA